MVILLLGSGGREHALAFKMLQSSKCSALFVAPGNAGTAEIATNVSINPTDFNAIKLFVIQEKIEMVVVGPEDPLVSGIYDFFKNDSVSTSSACPTLPLKQQHRQPKQERDMRKSTANHKQ